MDLLATVRKEGSRGGTGDFKWADVQSSSRRENYLGHSVMAPVGRWQKGRDLNWYAKTESNDADGENATERAARERKEEIRKVKEAEEDALARALGLPVPDRTNPNLQAIEDRTQVQKVLKEASDGVNDDTGRGIGFDRARGVGGNSQVSMERLEGNAEVQDRELQYALKEYKRRHGHGRQRNRSRSRSQDRDRRRRRQEDKYRNEERSLTERHHHRHRRSRSRSPGRGQRHRERRSSRSRSRSPYKRRGRDEHSERSEYRRRG